MIDCGISQSQIDAFTALYNEAEKLKFKFEEFDQYEQDGELFVTFKVK